MIDNLVRTCDMCHRRIPHGQYIPRNLDRNDPDVIMVLLENLDRELKIIELPDGTVSLDTCMSCYSRMPIIHSTAVN